ncbi:MAG: hypothetical protein ACEPOV_00975 [Hyphomicrobiales bacterium]
MKRLILAGVCLLLLSMTSVAQKIEHEWHSGERTKWYKNHIIGMAQSGVDGGFYRFDFEKPNDNSYFGIYSEPYGVFFSATPNGRIGIGTNAPEDKFHIKATTRLDADVNWVSGWRFNLLGAYHDFRIGSTKASDALYFSNSDGNKLLTILGNGNIGVGTDKPEKGFHVIPMAFFSDKVGIGVLNPEEKLDVAGNLKVSGTVFADRVSLNIGSFPDYVFEPEYKLRSLYDVEAFINQNKHLPGVPSEKEMVKGGMDLSKMNNLLMEKVEELTLYTIQQQKKLDDQNSKIQLLEQKLDKLSEQLNK